MYARIANSENPDQTGSSLIWVCTVCHTFCLVTSECITLLWATKDNHVWITNLKIGVVGVGLEGSSKWNMLENIFIFELLRISLFYKDSVLYCNGEQYWPQSNCSFVFIELGVNSLIKELVPPNIVQFFKAISNFISQSNCVLIRFIYWLPIQGREAIEISCCPCQPVFELLLKVQGNRLWLL